MKISVIVPIYNVEDYLCDCIESVIQQTHQDFELVLVDDGSTDSSGKICDQYTAFHPQQVKVIHTINGGPFQARLIGIQEANGDILVFLDSDDCLRNDALKQISVCFEREKCDMIMFDAGENGKFPTIQIKHRLEHNLIFEGVSKKEMYRSILVGKIPNSVCLKAVRAQCVKIPDYFHQCHAKYGEDLLLSTYLMWHCKKIVYLEEGLYHYRKRCGSAVNSFDIQRKEFIKIVHVELEKYFDQWGMSDLKSLHNARKVRGWVVTLKLLIKNRKYMDQLTYAKELKSMATDSYFRSAYSSMDRNFLSFRDQILAFCLYHRILG